MEELQAALNDAEIKICLLKGEALGMQSMIIAILRSLPAPQLANTLQEFDQETEIARVTLLNSTQAGEHVQHGLETYVQQMSAIRQSQAPR